MSLRFLAVRTFLLVTMYGGQSNQRFSKVNTYSELITLELRWSHKQFRKGYPETKRYHKRLFYFKFYT